MRSQRTGCWQWRLSSLWDASIVGFRHRVLSVSPNLFRRLVFPSLSRNPSLPRLLFPSRLLPLRFRACCLREKSLLTVAKSPEIILWRKAWNNFYSLCIGS